MDNRARAIHALKAFQSDAPVQVWPAIVKSIQGTNCTVDLINTDLVDVPEVNLRADDEATEGVLLVPRVGSFVYVAAVENALDNLFVCLVSEVDSVQVKIGSMSALVTKDQVQVSNGKTALTLDKDQVHAVHDQCELTLSDKATLKQGQTSVELSGGKVKVANAGVNLKDLFSDLLTLLQTFQVICASPGAPSASIFPTTLASITQLSTKVNLLLQ